MTDQAVIDAFEAARKRVIQYREQNVLADADVRKLKLLIVGKRVFKLDRLYEITDVSSSYDFGITARGYRIIGNNKRGTQIWDIGPIGVRYLEDAEKEDQ